VYLSEL